MQALVQVIRHALVICGFLSALAVGGGAFAAPYASMVMDARTGEVLFARNHDTKLHPASLTKMMTLYVAFEAIKHGELTLDTMITVSRRATGTECVCLGLRPGQRISMRNLIRAAALRSANDAAVVLAEGISGSVEDFGRRMTRTARAIGMSNTTFLNPHGLTQNGHVSTARDMTILGRQLYFDYPQYFNLFSRRSENAGAATVTNTNRRFLDSYSGADGIKTGYTRAAGFNLTASAQRGSKHIITTMFGGTSTAARNAKVAELMDLGFSKARDRVASRAPATPAYQGRGNVAVAQADPEVMSSNPTSRPAAAKTIRLQTAVRTSPRPLPRPNRTDVDVLLAKVAESVDAEAAQIALAAATPAPVATAPELPAIAPPPRPDNLTETAVPDLEVAQAAGFRIVAPEDLAALDEPIEGPEPAAQADASATVPEPEAEKVIAASTENAPEAEPTPVVAGADTPTEIAQTDPAQVETMWSGAADTVTLTAAPALGAGPDDNLAFNANVDLDYQPQATEAPEPDLGGGIILTRAPAPDAVFATPDLLTTAQVSEAQSSPELEVVSRLSTSDAGRLWGVSLGEFSSRSAAERGLITVKMAEASALGNGISRIRQTGGRYEAVFAGLSAQEAERACLRLQARGMECLVSHP